MCKQNEVTKSKDWIKQKIAEIKMQIVERRLLPLRNRRKGKQVGSGSREGATARRVN